MKTINVNFEGKDIQIMRCVGWSSEQIESFIEESEKFNPELGKHAVSDVPDCCAYCNEYLEEIGRNHDGCCPVCNK